MQVEFIAANVISVLHFIDQGTIHTIKQKFYRSFVLRLLPRLNFTEESYKMSLLNAVSMPAMVWN
jgi:hypothetical protein